MTEMERGKITKIIVDRGFGFVLREGDPPHARGLFFHFRDLPAGTLFDQELVGQEVTFSAVKNEKGWAARNITFADSSSAVGE